MAGLSNRLKQGAHSFRESQDGRSAVNLQKQRGGEAMTSLGDTLSIRGSWQRVADVSPERVPVSDQNSCSDSENHVSFEEYSGKRLPAQSATGDHRVYPVGEYHRRRNHPAPYAGAPIRYGHTRSGVRYRTRCSKRSRSSRRLSEPMRRRWTAAKPSRSREACYACSHAAEDALGIGASCVHGGPGL